MTNPLFKFTSPFLDKKRAYSVPVILVRADKFGAWLQKQDRGRKNFIAQSDFTGEAGKALAIRGADGSFEGVLACIGKPCGLYDLASAVAAIRSSFGKSLLSRCSFHLSGEALQGEEIESAHMGWALACYRFDHYKASPAAAPMLVWSESADKKRILARAQASGFLRNIINAPSNDMGPDELESAARFIAGPHQAKIDVLKDQRALEKEFPMVYAVGKGSERSPRMIDLRWGNPRHPKVTIVGKGVCFDTGGLNIKPTPAMALMKKDMGGAAHALALASLVMDLRFPVRLRVIIPAVENSIGGNSFRPGDILRSRKGFTVENTNTDAEGRLILADALTLACEENPDLLIDFATLTGSARAGFGPDIPPFFSTNDGLAEKLKVAGRETEDPVWPLPLWKPYLRHLDSPVADMVNSSGVPGDLMYSALFLQRFLLGSPDWIHLDVYAWEHIGRPGRPKGGAETGLWAILALLERKYGEGEKDRKEKSGKKK